MWVSACVSLVTVSEIGRIAFLSPISLCESSEQRWAAVLDEYRCTTHAVCECCLLCLDVAAIYFSICNAKPKLYCNLNFNSQLQLQLEIVTVITCKFNCCNRFCNGNYCIHK